MMTHRLTIPVVIAALALGGAAACGGNPEPEGPTQAELDQARQDSLDAAAAARRAAEQARLDSIAAAEEAARRAAEREAASARAVLEEMIHFAYDRSEIRADARETLTAKVAVMRANPQVQLRIAGHADERGSIEYNRALGQRRAEAAKDFLVNFGIDASRITTVSFGEDRPLVNESNEEAWAKNRRDEFVIVAGGDQLRNPGGP
ncbi:MAG: peptidoglycan-associated lipoprotein Pal [Gemmatimonadetes bacterium]|nr:peptidoglycan-associated lipoprotein Pal [Gemmatimonadota bacterium]NIX44853.1 peptidoglycan-associated lipoprotein Pal [Gemmatimonadota bacterium]